MGPSKTREGAALLSAGKERPAGSSPWTLVLIAVGAFVLLVGGAIVLAVHLTRCRPPSVSSVAASCASFVAHPANALWAHTTPPLATAASVSSIDIVVSFCSSDLSWLDSFSQQIRTLSGGVVPAVIVYSKCGANTSSAQLRLTAPISHVERVLPNAGRCDHTYAYHMANHAGDGGTLADLTLFVKDTLNPARPQVRLFGNGGEPHFNAELPIDNLRSIDVWFRQLITDGFACSYDAGYRARGASHWHDLDTVRSFHMDEAYENGQSAGFESPIKPLGAWLDNITRHGGGGSTVGSARAGALWPVCYGGNFGATRGVIERQPLPVWQALEASLGRGPDSVEEGHYAERMWAGLMHAPLSAAQEAALRAAAAQLIEPTWCYNCPYHGQLLNQCCRDACAAA